MEKTEMKYRRVAVAILSGLGLGLVVAGMFQSTAQANNDKIFAPQSCVAIDEDDVNDKASYHIDRVQQTDGGDKQDFICPLIREEVEGVLHRVWVRVENENKKAKEVPDCCVYSVSLGGSMTDFECEKADKNDGVQSLEFELKDFTEYDHGFYAVKCELGQDDSILGIRTSEEPKD